MSTISMSYLMLKRESAYFCFVLFCFFAVKLPIQFILRLLYKIQIISFARTSQNLAPPSDQYSFSRLTMKLCCSRAIKDFRPITNGFYTTIYSSICLKRASLVQVSALTKCPLYRDLFYESLA